MCRGARKKHDDVVVIITTGGVLRVNYPVINLVQEEDETLLDDLLIEYEEDLGKYIGNDLMKKVKSIDLCRITIHRELIEHSQVRVYSQQ